MDAVLNKLVVLVKDHDSPVDVSLAPVLHTDGVVELEEVSEHDDVGVDVDPAVQVQNENSEQIGEVRIPELSQFYLGQAI